MGLRVTTAPTTWPVSLAAAKMQCRVYHTDDDLLLYNADTSNPGLVQLATGYLEKRWNLAFLTQTLTLALDGWYDLHYWLKNDYATEMQRTSSTRLLGTGSRALGYGADNNVLGYGGGLAASLPGALWIPRPPLASVTSIQYWSTDAAWTTWASTNYIVDTNQKPGRVALAPTSTWPIIQSGRVQDAVRIVYTAGYTSTANLFAEMPAAIQAIKAVVSDWYYNPTLRGTNVSKELDGWLAELDNQCTFDARW